MSIAMEEQLVDDFKVGGVELRLVQGGLMADLLL